MTPVATESVGQRLKRVRELLLITQETLHKRIDVSRAYIADIEADRKEPSWNFLVKLINKINISGDWLITGFGSKFRDERRETVRDRLVEFYFPLGKKGVKERLKGMGLDPDVCVVQEAKIVEVDEEVLLRVMRLEGFRHEWLFHGQGTPFPVGYYRRDLDARERLESLLVDMAGWHVYLVTDRAIFCVVLIAPAWSEVQGGHSYEYTVWEVIGGAVGRQTLGAVRKLLGRYAIYVVVVATGDLLRLVNGQVGTYELMGRGTGPDFLHQPIKLERPAQVDEYIPEPVWRVDPDKLAIACSCAGEDPQSGRILYGLSNWLPTAHPDDRVFLEGLLKRHFNEFGEPIQNGRG